MKRTAPAKTRQAKQYQPSQDILRKYAELLVLFALNNGEGVKPGEVVQCVVPDVAKPLALELQNAVLRGGGYPIIHLLPTGFEKDYFSLASEKQLTFFPEKYMREKVNLIDHTVSVIADVNPTELQDIPPQKIMMARNAKKSYMDWRREKEVQGNFTWTVGLWGVESKAKIVGLTLEEYWEQIILACYLDQENPIAEWRKIFALQEQAKKGLNSLSIEWLDIVGPDVNLRVKLGPDRLWAGGSGRNIPSFELFTSPDWRGTQGWIKFNEPVYRYGVVMKDIRLEFENGLITKAKAKVGNELLQEMLKTPNANKLGEFSLTDKRMSRITHPMAETLFDENISGPFGNMHVAVGMAYRECCRGDITKITKEGWAEKGFNDSAEHTDIITTTDRTVTATLTSGETKVIYKDGMFLV